jgi:hypothetical protein
MNKIKMTDEQSKKLKSQIKMGILLYLYNSKLVTTAQIDELLKKIK